MLNIISITYNYNIYMSRYCMFKYILFNDSTHKMAVMK